MLLDAPTVAVIGGGLQGCLAALALAARGLPVTIFERRERLLQGASRTNEGKIHAGFTYALDASLETIDLLSRHAADFQPHLAGLLRRDPQSFVRHERTVYAMHRESLLSLEAADEHFQRVDRLWLERAARGRGRRPEPCRRWSAGETRAAFGGAVLAAYEVSETVVDPEALCAAVAAAIEADPRITVETRSRVAMVEQGTRLALIATDGAHVATADYAVNCAWEDLPGIAQRSGADPRGLCLRAKAAFVARAHGQLPLPLTISFGPFGDVVPLGPDRVYLSWYPACLAGFTTDIDDGVRWHDQVGARFDPVAAYRHSAAALTALCPGLALAGSYETVHVCVIVAEGRSDIVDPRSRLHRRTAIGIARSDRLFSINTGKLASAATFAVELAGMFTVAP